MGPRLTEKLAEIAARHQISDSQIAQWQFSLQSWDSYPLLEKTATVGSIRELTSLPAIAKERIARVAIVHPCLVIVDDEIPTLCQRLYLRPDGELKSCGGIRHHRSCCPPFAPLPSKTRETLDRANAIVFIKSEGSTDISDQKRLHATLLRAENHFKRNGFDVVGSWAAGPCRICETDKVACLGNGDCRTPAGRRYSLEGSGVAVFATGDVIAKAVNDNGWRFKVIENWELPNQSEPSFSSVVGIAVK